MRKTSRNNLKLRVVMTLLIDLYCIVNRYMNWYFWIIYLNMWIEFFWYLWKFYKTFYSSKSSFCQKTKVANLSLAISWLRYLKQKSLYFFGPKILIYHANLFYLSWNYLKDEICCSQSSLSMHSPFI